MRENSCKMLLDLSSPQPGLSGALFLFLNKKRKKRERRKEIAAQIFQHLHNQLEINKVCEHME